MAKIQVLFNEIKPFKEASAVLNDSFYCDDAVMPTEQRIGFISLEEGYAVKSVVAGVKEDLKEVGLIEKKDFQIVIWE